MERITNKNLLKNLGKRILALRKARLLTQEELAERADLHPTYIGGIERGERNPTVYTLLRIAEGLEVEIKDLLAPVSGKAAGEREAMLLEIMAMLESRNVKDLKWIKMVVADIIRWSEKHPAKD
jgi:transcriptional regulator with XRE-family HTH domain